MSAIRNTLGRSWVRNSRASPYSRSQNHSKFWGLSSLWSYLYPPSQEQQVEEEEEEDEDAPIDDPNQEENDLMQPIGDHLNRMAADALAPPRTAAAHRGAATPPQSPMLPNFARTDSPFAPRTGRAMAPPPVPRPNEHYTQNFPQTPNARGPNDPDPMTPYVNNTAPTPENTPNAQQEAITRYILEREREGRPLNALEIEGLIALLQKAAEEEYKHETFSFATTSSTSSHSQLPTGNSTLPSFLSASANGSQIATSSSLPALSNSINGSSSSPRKVLTRNPNGEYRWVGGGSARTSTARSRSRSRSPISTPPKSTPGSESKRRRVGEDRESSKAESSGLSSSQTMPSLSSSSMNGSTSGPSASLSPAKASRFPQVHPLRASILPKTTPVRPSPLRQSYTQASPPSPASPPQRLGAPITPTPQQRTSTHAANVLSEIIEKVTPPTRPDLSNPYQTASPVKPRLKEKKKLTDRKGKAKEKQVDEVKELENEKKVAVEGKADMPSPREIIEATIPKGIKRSRPPASLSKSNGVAPPGIEFRNGFRRSARLHSPEPEQSLFAGKPMVEEVDDEETLPNSKKQKKHASVTVEEVDDDDMFASERQPKSGYVRPAEIVEPGDTLTNGIKPSSPGSPFPLGSATNGPNAMPQNNPFGSKSSLFGGAKSSLPKEPSKLRRSFLAEEEDAVLPESKAASIPKSTSSIVSLNGARIPFGETQLNGAVSETISSFSPKDPKAIASALDPSSLPIFAFNFTSTQPTNPKFIEARDSALMASEVTLPKYELFDPFSKRGPRKSTSGSAVKPFDWAAAGMKPKESSLTGKWICGECYLESPDSAKEKCAVCDAPRPGASAISISKSADGPPMTGFNWAAAGLKPPTTNGDSGGSWKCGTCDLDNPASAKEKCTVCEAARP